MANSLLSSIKSKWLFIVAIALVVFLLDQVSKHWIIVHVPFDVSIPIIPGIFEIIHTRNKGAAFGFMADLPESIRMPFFFITSTLALVGMIYYFSKQYPSQKIVHVSLGLILGGAMGNIFDRVTLGEVVDFISFHYYDRWADFSLFGRRIFFRWEWPAFNVADSAICIAITLLLFFMLKDEKRNKGVYLP